ncbi:hypothetical protein [Helicobacter suis]|uniref:Sialidase A n=4 Tax=Helicobacter suis TaxID=104628 RepID=E7G4P3_9HELI|nr:hypothetical protein [Helicobacter suis]EFX41736.1 hypothetical protein HSUHS5_0955 [Helicobacter suis HS5]EFX43330.1 putative outer membrane protein [Helicobacter suis HS1]BCD46926.1 Sialidase A [Helicobacter suis]BCD48684.1 Sialidase A [Helicobacter suis]BCD50462.1 Sialidase A [Helicobacter suis]
MNEQEKIEALDQALALLQEKGIKEIVQTTKIANPRIKAILEKDFNSLQRVHAVGFLQILEKEYRIDLSQWLVEYDKKNSFAGSKESPKEVNATPAPQEQKVQKESKQEQEKPLPFLDAERVGDLPPPKISYEQKTSKWVFIVPVIVLALALGLYLHYSTNTTQESISENTPLAKTPDSPSQPQITSTQSSPTPQEQSIQTKTSEQNQPQPKLTQESPAPSSTPSGLKSAENTPPSNTPNTPPSKEEQPPKEEAEKYPTIEITPKEDVWMESIDLHTKDKKQTILKEPFTLNTQGHKWLLAFGHGNLSIKANGKLLDFNRERPLRFLYTPKGGLRRLSLAHYQERSR